LEAEDIDKKVMKFNQFKGKITVITNVASFCGFTDSHYKGLVELYNQFKASPIGFNILAFPCNQFGEQEPNKCPAIKKFAKSKGVEFTMMNKVDVNGVDASPVYDYLKKVAGPPRITWNFATYYVVSPDGTVKSYSGVEPLDLKDVILDAMGMDKNEL
jgi:glutathione peroxidase